MLAIKNITYKTSTADILPATSLHVEQGKHLLLLGPSGCGKTTLLNIASGLLRASGGDVFFQNQSYAALSNAALDEFRARNFGFIFQRLHLLGHLTVRQNIALAQPAQNNDRIKTLLADLGLSGMENRKASNLSVGEAQRVCIARALANTPKVIFADEPTSALDDANTEKVMDLIFTQAQKTGASVIAATHDARIKHRFTDILEMTV